MMVPAQPTRPFRVAIVGLLHEANTFADDQAELAHYQDRGLFEFDQIRQQFADSNSVVGGFLAPADDGIEVVPLVVAGVPPCGPVSAAAWDFLLTRMETELSNGGPWDGVLVYLHGACVAEGYQQADATLVQTIRTAVGEAPLGFVLDMHANLHQELVDEAQVVTAYQTNPHIDPRDQAIRCRAQLARLLHGEPGLAMVVEQIPLVVTIIRQDTSTEPMASILAYAAEVAAQSGAWDVSVLQGFPYADVSHMGMSVLVSHDDEHQARAAARRVAHYIWDRRSELTAPALAVGEAVAALKEVAGPAPLLVLDVGDNIGGGGPGNSTVLLRAVEQAEVGNTVSFLYSPETVHALSGHAVGDVVSVMMPDSDAGQGKFEWQGTIVGRHYGVFAADGPVHGGNRYFDPGEQIAIRSELGNVVIVMEKLIQTISPVQLDVVGLPRDQWRAILAKGVNAPRAGYGNLTSGVLEVDTPGRTQNDVTRFGYRHRRRPMFPYEPDAEYPSSTGAVR